MFAKTLLMVCTLMVCLDGFTYADTSRGDRMEWWRQARFGLFIHWGLYAVPAGEYEGERIRDYGEWIMDRARIPRADYRRFALQFNPELFDADAWVRMAKHAGMRYLVVTAKHHDGFCLFETESTQYNVVDGTPFSRDILKELRDACERHGIMFCTYYSIMDWEHVSQLPAREENGRPVWNPTRLVDGKKDLYVEYMKDHLKDLVQVYRTQLLWFDGEWPDWWTDQDGQNLYKWLIELNPELLINNRIGAGRERTGFVPDGAFAGDFGTPEQIIPPTGIDMDWESCMTMNDTWGYKSYDDNWKSAGELIRNLIDTASKGGNYLLNVGPDAQGRFPQASVDRLREIGCWMSTNEESIRGTKAALFAPDWGRVTRKDGALYLHVFHWPKDGLLKFPALVNTFRRASFLADPSVRLEMKKENDQWVLSVPLIAPDRVASVIVLDVEGMPELK